MNLLPLEEGERITRCCRSASSTEDKFVFMATAHGTVKKTPLVGVLAAAHQRHHRARAATTDDRLVGVAHDRRHARHHAVRELDGKAIRFSRSRRARRWAATAAGVRGIKLAGAADEVIALIVAGDGPILTATENGYGKLTPIEELSRCRVAAGRA